MADNPRAQPQYSHLPPAGNDRQVDAGLVRLAAGTAIRPVSSIIRHYWGQLE